MFEWVKDHYEIAKYELTPIQFREKFIYQAILKVLCLEVQDLEDTMWNMYYNRTLNTAEGVQLDNLGAMLGVQRKVDMSDYAYRMQLRYTIATRRSDGTGNTILRMMTGFYDSVYGQVFEHIDKFTGGICVRVNNSADIYRAATPVLREIVPMCMGSVAILRDTTEKGLAWTPVEFQSDNAELVDQDLSWFETDGLLGIVVDSSNLGLVKDPVGELADPGLVKGYVQIYAHGDIGHIPLEARNDHSLEQPLLQVDEESMAGGIYGYMAEVSQIRMGHTTIEGEQP